MFVFPFRGIYCFCFSCLSCFLGCSFLSFLCSLFVVFIVYACCFVVFFFFFFFFLIVFLAFSEKPMTHAIFAQPSCSLKPSMFAANKCRVMAMLAEKEGKTRLFAIVTMVNSAFSHFITLLRVELFHPNFSH